jgi:hypothetical protein
MLRARCCGEAECLDELSTKIFELSHRYMLEGLKTYCLSYMMRNFSQVNVIEFYCLAKKYEVSQLTEKAKRYLMA